MPRILKVDDVTQHNSYCILGKACGRRVSRLLKLVLCDLLT